MRITNNEDPAIRNRWRCDDGLWKRFGAELILIENFCAACAGLQNEKLTILSSDIKLAISEHGRRLLNRPEILQPELFAGVHVKRGEVCTVIYLIKSITIEDGRREPTLPTI